MKKGKKWLPQVKREWVINLFSWDWFVDFNDRIVEHPSSIDFIVKFDEDTISTGWEDDLVRAVSILPKRILETLSTKKRVFTFNVSPYLTIKSFLRTPHLTKS